MSDRTSATLRTAEEDDFDEGVRLASLEHSLALESPSLRGAGSAAALGTLAAGIALFAPFAGALAPLGGSARDLFAGTAPMGPELERAVVLVSFWLGAAGLAWALADWIRSGRPRSAGALGIAVLSLLAAAGAAAWHVWRAEPASLPSLLVPIVLTGALALVSIVARLVASSRVSAREARLAAMGERMRSLPHDEQATLLTQRERIIATLERRGIIDPALGQRARAARLGDWWLVDGSESSAGHPSGAA